jgi:RNA polymerase sigma factor (sigma-70 family)
MTDDGTLLRQFLETGSESAFAELVQRYFPLVHSAAQRQVGGDSERAQDVAQSVFTELARKARTLTGRRCLAGWLYNTARFMALRESRSELRRAQRERAFLIMPNDSTESALDLAWKEIRPIIDEVMLELDERDRQAVILRFFQNHSLADISAMLQTTENAARMRVERALEKLRLRLSRRGIKSSAAVLGAALTTCAVSSTTPMQAALVIGPALGAAAAGTLSGSLSLLSFMTSTQLKLGMAGLALIGVTTGFVTLQASKQRLVSELAAQKAETRHLAEQLEQAALRAPEPDRRDEVEELARLRAEVTQLRAERRRQQANAAIDPSPAQNAQTAAITPEQNREFAENLGIAKMTLAKTWGMALASYAHANNGQMPDGLDEAQAYFPDLPKELTAVLGLSSADDFEIVFHGRLSDLPQPERIIIVRDKEAFAVQADGSALRTYLFADGHSEVHRAPNGDFSAWEQEHMAPGSPH